MRRHVTSPAADLVSAGDRAVAAACAGVASFRTFWGWDAQGAIDPNYSGVVSTVGTIGTQVGFVSADVLGNIGSLGTAILVPAPGVAAFASLFSSGRNPNR